MVEETDREGVDGVTEDDDDDEGVKGIGDFIMDGPFRLAIATLRVGEG